MTIAQRLPRPANLLRLPLSTAALGALAAVLVTAAIALWANPTLDSDLYWLLADGRFLSGHPFSTVEPFATLHHGGRWLNQQWLTAWLFYRVVAIGGLTLLSLLYALVVGLAMLPLVWGCRNRAPWAVAGCWLLMLPTLVAVTDVRAAGFSLLAMSLLIVSVDRRSRRWPVFFVPLIFLVWAQMHAAFVAGLLFLGLVVAGAAWDRVRGSRDAFFSKRFLLFALCPVMVLLTPLRGLVFAYISLIGRDGPLLRTISLEWQPTYWHPWFVLYVLAVAGWCALLWHLQPQPRRSEPLIVALGFCLFAMTATRQLVWLGPVCFYVLRTAGPAVSLAVPRRLLMWAAAIGAAAMLAWPAWAAPAQPETVLLTGADDYAAAHVPCRGRIATTPGPGSYMMWANPRAPILTDGRLELYSPGEIEGSYTIANGAPGAAALIRRWQVTAVLTRNRNGVGYLERRGFVLRTRAGDGYYLTLPGAGDCGSGAA
jgi:hypothetical protein